jgi:signal peptidase I
VTPGPAGPLTWEPDLAEDQPRPPGLGSDRPGTRPPGGFLREVPALVGAAVVVAFLLRTFLFQAFYIPSPSMGCRECPVHTLEINDKILVSKLSYRLHDPRRGDIVVFDCPDAPGVVQCNNRKPSNNPVVGAFRWLGERIGVVPPSTEDYIKRVIGLPGDSIEIEGGAVFVNGEPLDEPYLPDGLRTDADSRFPHPYVVPADSLLVLGDNRPNSSDGRRFLAIPRKTVIGRAVVRFWPAGRVGFL